MFGSLPDLLRLLTVPVLGWAAWQDLRTRRVPNRLWLPLAGLGVVLLAWDLLGHLPPADLADRLFLVQVAISLGFVAPFSYLFWRLGGFGGADAKALIVLAVVFPAFPTYFLPSSALPLVETPIGVFSFTVLTNTVVVALAYPLVLGLRNALVGEFAPIMVFGRRVAVEDLRTAHGRLFETTSGYTRNGLDIDALRMYLRWRGESLETLRSAPDELCDPASVVETHDPTDGRVLETATDGGTDVGAVPSDVTGLDTSETAPDAPPGRTFDDPWAAERFLDSIEGTAYGTTPETLRDGLELVGERDQVWISPGIPFLVPMFVGLVVGLLYGDLLFGLLGVFGVS